MPRLMPLLVLVVAILVAAGAWWLIRSQSAQPNGPATLLRFSPADVVEVRVHDGGRTHRLERTSGAEWSIMPDEGTDKSPWPVAASAVRAVLSILADLRFDEAGAPEPGAPESTMVTLVEADGRTSTLTFLGRPIGGRSLARAHSGDSGTTMFGFIDDGVREMLANPGPRAWREMMAMPGVGVEASRVRIRTADVDLLLGQVAGAWTLREPVAARAAPTAVERILGTITSLKVERFVEDGSVTAESAGLLEPTLTIIAETDARTIDAEGNVRVTTSTRRIDIGGPADMDGAGLFASADGGATIFVVAGNALRALPRDPIECIARPASGVLPSNVGMVHVRFPGGVERGYRRGVDGWSELSVDGRLLPIEDEPIQDLLDFLATRLPPDLRILGEHETPGTEWATAMVFDFADRPLDEVVLVDVNGQPGAVSGRVLRVYTGAWPELLAPSQPVAP